MFDILTTGDALNYGYYNDGPQWAMNINSIDIDLVNANSHNIELTVHASFYKNWDMLNGIFSNTTTRTIDVDALLYSVINPETDDFLIAIELVEFDINDFPDFIEDFGFFYLRFQGLTIMNLIKMYPNLNPQYFSDPTLEVTETDLIVSINLNESIVVGSKSVNEPEEYLTGELSLTNYTTPELTQLNIESPSNVFARLNDEYTAQTHNRTIGNEVHWNWSMDVDHKLLTGSFFMNQEFFDIGLSAWYKNQSHISINTNVNGADLYLHDPWHLDQSTQTQPDEFRPLNEQIDENGNVQVFLNQNTIFHPDKPIYRLKAPTVGDILQNDIMVFDYWSGDGIDFGGGSTSTTNRETDIVFLEPGAQVTAHYVSALDYPGRDVTISEGETVLFPEGGTYEWDPSSTAFQMNVYGNLIFNGTEDNPITIGPSSQPNLSMGGIYVDDGGSLVMNYVQTTSQFYGINGAAIILENGDATITNCQFLDVPEGGIYISPHASAYIAHNVFQSSLIYPFQSPGVECNIDQSTGNSVSILHNTILDFRTSVKTHCNTTHVSDRLDMRNNIFMFTGANPSGTICFDHTIDNYNTVKFNYNLSFGYENVGLSGIPTVYRRYWIVNDNPLLNNNHHLTENSSCIDAGDPDSPLDPDGTRLDMGAFYFDKVPNAPTGFTILGDVGDHPELTWDEHEESDVNEFLIYRSLNYGAFLFTATVSQTNWVDTEVTINNEKKFSNRACYYIKAVDAIMQESTSTSPQCESVNIGLKKQAFTLIPKEYEWSSVHPNPFNPKTTIQYGLPVSSHITFTIHNMVGQLVKTIQSKDIPAGVHSIQWNSLNDAGEKVPSGMYIVQMKATSTNWKKHFTHSQKVVLLK